MDQELKKEFEDLTKIVKSGFDSNDQRFVGLEQKMVTLKEKMTTLEEKTATLEEKMATKEDLNKLRDSLLDSMDIKLADLKGDLVLLMRKEDFKLLRLVELLKEKKVLSEDEVKEIFSMEPFPKLAL